MESTRAGDSGNQLRQSIAPASCTKQYSLENYYPRFPTVETSAPYQTPELKFSLPLQFSIAAPLVSSSSNTSSTTSSQDFNDHADGPYLRSQSTKNLHSAAVRAKPAYVDFESSAPMDTGSRVQGPETLNGYNETAERRDGPGVSNGGHSRLKPVNGGPFNLVENTGSREGQRVNCDPNTEGGSSPFSQDSHQANLKGAEKSPGDLKAMADTIPAAHSEAHLMISPQPQQEQNAHPLHTSQSELFHKPEKNSSQGNVLDDIHQNRNLHNTQSLPTWMPSVVNTTISENVEAQTFDGIGDISLEKLREDVAKVDVPHAHQSSSADRQLMQTKSMSSMSIPDRGKGSSIDTTKRRQKKNNEHANLRNLAEKFTGRNKKKLMRKLTRVQNDGTVDFDLGGSARYADNLLAGPQKEDEESGVDEDMVKDEGDTVEPIPPLKIVMLIVGTRGDVQPFVAIGKKMQEYGHRVRLASHANFKDFVKSAGLEFYPLGGDPKVLAEYMVKNKGFLPSGPKEAKVQRKQIKSIVNSLLDPCIEPDLDSGVPFQAQAIIANPPAYGHVHVAEYLKVPLHLFFTMPWTATSAFPHPLSRVSKPAGYKLSYQVVDTLIWFGIRSIINDFRKKKLKLRPITYLSSSQGSIDDLPTGYLWSPHLVPKPKDWGPLIDVVGFCFLNQADDYKPPEDLVNWLKAGPQPIYVGFGSLPVQDPEGMTKIIVEALKKTNQRGFINQGWGGMGKLDNPPEYVYLIQDCPHDWLFPKCAAVVHHGGAGTTAAGLKAACPTTVVPFFGDQPFWGSHIHEKGVGPVPIPVNEFSLEKLVDAIRFMLDPEVKRKATEIAEAMSNEDGIQGAVDVFHRHIRKKIPAIMQDAPGESPVDDNVQKKTHRFGGSCWSCGNKN